VLGTANPSYIGTQCVVPSPASTTTPVVRPEAYNAQTSCILTYKQGTLNFSNIILVVFSLFYLGLRAGSVSITGCSSDFIFRSSEKI